MMKEQDAMLAEAKAPASLQEAGGRLLGPKWLDPKHVEIDRMQHTLLRGSGTTTATTTIMMITDLDITL